MSFASAVQDAARLLSIVVPSDVVSSADTATMQLASHAHVAGDDIARRADWSRMAMTTTTTSGPWAVPATFLRLVPGGAVNITSPAFAPVRGPLSSEGLAAVPRFGATAHLFYGMTGGTMQFSRALASETVEITYVDTRWLISSDGTTRRLRATANDDVTLFPEGLMIKAIVWRYRRDKGLPWQDHLAEWEADVAFEIKQDRGVTT